LTLNAYTAVIITADRKFTLRLVVGNVYAGRIACATIIDGFTVFFGIRFSFLCRLLTKSADSFRN